MGFSKHACCQFHFPVVVPATNVKYEIWKEKEIYRSSVVAAAA